MASPGVSRVEAFLTWWGRELSSLAPPGSLFAAKKNRIRIKKAEREGAYTLARGGAAPPVSGEASEIGAALSAAGLREPAELTLPAADVLALTIALPERAMERAREILALEIESATPFAADEILFDFLPCESTAPGTRQVRLFVAKRTLIEQQVANLSGAGVRIDKVSVEGADGVNLLPHALRPPRRTRIRVKDGLLLGALALLAASAFYRQERALGALEARRAELVAQTQEVRKAAADANAAAANIASLGQRMDENPSPLRVLGVLTSVLNNDVWLTEMTMAGRNVSISGYAASASGALGAIESSTEFEGAALTSTVFTDQASKSESFAARFRVEARGRDGDAAPGGAP